jgi:MerR family transcriptional regulator, light-induced transcriptional regulator
MPVASLCRRYLEAQLAGDRREATRLVLDEGLGAGLTVTQLQVGVIQAAQREIGRLWQETRIGIAQEHMATAISQVVLSRLFEAGTPEDPLGRKVLVACVEGELHEFPARLVADFLELAGFEVRYLGADVPVDDLARMIAEERPDLVALSITMSFNAPALRRAVEHIRAAHPALPILVGGNALEVEPDLAERLGVASCGPQPDRVVGSARALTLGEAA